MRLHAIALCAVAACYRPAAEAPCTVTCTSECPDGLACIDGLCQLPGGGCSAVGDAPAMDGVVADADNCYGHDLYQFCMQPRRPGSLELGGLTINTGVDTTLCDQPAPTSAYCVISAGAITVTTTPFRANGTKPVILVADTITVSSSIDVSSSSFSMSGAGAQSVCPVGMAAQDGANGAGGGAGGSFIGTGGNGGSSDGSGAQAGAQGSLSMIRGGCPGSPGAGSTVGTGGAGGGAVVLIAKVQVNVAGAVLAFGAGGAGGTSGGGGGGGAGGLIAIDAPMVIVSGRLLAGGGGGGGGSGSTLGGPGGEQGVTTGTMAVGGTRGGTIGGRGGNGGGGLGGPLNGASGETVTAGTSYPCGGGGGGGSGVIRVRGMTTYVGGSIVAPAPS